MRATRRVNPTLCNVPQDVLQKNNSSKHKTTPPFPHPLLTGHSMSSVFCRGQTWLFFLWLSAYSSHIVNSFSADPVLTNWYVMLYFICVHIAAVWDQELITSQCEDWCHIRTCTCVSTHTHYVHVETRYNAFAGSPLILTTVAYGTLFVPKLEQFDLTLIELVFTGPGGTSIRFD